MRALFTALFTLVLSTAALIGRAEEQNAPAAPEGPPSSTRRYAARHQQTWKVAG